MYHKLIAITVLFAASSGSAFAVFSAAAPGGSVPEAPGLALLAAGALAVGALRYLRNRKRDDDR